MRPTILARRWLQAREKDMANAEVALDIYARLLAYLKRSPVFLVDHTTATIVLEAKNFGRGLYFNKLFFMVGKKNEMFYNRLRQMIYVGDPFYNSQNPEASAISILSQPKIRPLLIHELTHHVDALRMKDGWFKAEKSYAGPQEDPETYYNHPLEMNAYFQQGSHAVMRSWQEILKDFTPDAPNEDAYALALMGMDDLSKETFKQFHADVLRPLPDLFWGYLTPANQRRFTKRVYDLYDNTVLEARRQIQQLRRKKDPHRPCPGALTE